MINIREPTAPMQKGAKTWVASYLAVILSLDHILIVTATVSYFKTHLSSKH